MAENPDGKDQQRIENAINELTDRKNDIALNRASTSSTAQKRPSPSPNDCKRSFKRHNSSQDGPSTATQQHPTTTTTTTTTSTTNATGIDNKIEISNDNAMIRKNDENHSNNDAKAGECSSRTSSSSSSSNNHHQNEWYKPMPLSCKRIPIKPNPLHLDDSFIEKIRNVWITDDNETNSVNDDNALNINEHVKLYNKPFKICIIQEFLQNKTQVQRMVYEMCQMEWQRKQMDLYEFHQTTDLANISAFTKPNLKKFYNMMSNDVLPWMRKITGLNLTHISASCSMYNYGDYLLVHDDLLSDRRIAFVYYLSPWIDQWTDEMGGALELFECDDETQQPKYPIVKKFPPRNDQFIFFRVCKQSFHQVGEVTNLVYPRLTINGWFHGPALDSNDSQDDISMTTDDGDHDDDDDASNNFLNVNNVEMLAPLNDEINLSEWIDPSYLKRRMKSCIQQHIEDKSEASLESFLIKDFFDLLLSEFRENTELNWVLEGPANQQKYETLRFTQHSTGPPKDLYTLFASKSMFGLLHEYTELDFDGPHAKTPTCSIQICRFTRGCYTLLGSQSTYSDSALEAILFFGAKDGVGKITYLCPSEDPNEYNTTADTEATASGTDESYSFNSSNLVDNSSINVSLSTKSTTHVNWKRPMNQSDLKTKKSAPASGSASASVSASTSKGLNVTSSDISIDDMSASDDPQDAEVIAIMKSTATDNECELSKNETETETETSVPNHSTDNDSSSSGEILPLSDDECDELAQEESLLTIHPKNNSLNLVYRLAGQTKFIKYISKNALKPDEYIYILMATYKE